MPRPEGPPRLSYSKGSMATLCRTWRHKPSKRRAEVNLTSFLPARPLCMLAQWSSRALWWLPTTFYWGRHLCLTHLSYCKGLSSRGTALFSHFPCTSAQAVSQAQKTTPFSRSCGEHASGQNHIKGNFRRTPQLQAVRDPTLGQSSQAELHRGIGPGFWLGKGGQEGILLETLLQLHHRGNLSSLRDI